MFAIWDCSGQNRHDRLPAAVTLNRHQPSLLQTTKSPIGSVAVDTEFSQANT